MLEKHLGNSFFCVWWFKWATCKWNSSFPEVLHKELFWKTSQNLQINTRSSVSGGVLSKDILKNFAKFTDKRHFASFFFNKVAGWKHESVRSSHWRCSVKKGFSETAVHRSFTKQVLLENWQNSQEKRVLESFFNKAAVLRTCIFIKEDSETGAFLWNFQNF